MNEGLGEVLEEGIKYTDVTRAGTEYQKVRFIRHNNGKLFTEAGDQITGSDESSLNGQLEMGFFTPVKFC